MKENEEYETKKLVCKLSRNIVISPYHRDGMLVGGRRMCRKQRICNVTSVVCPAYVCAKKNNNESLRRKCPGNNEVISSICCEEK